MGITYSILLIKNGYVIIKGFDAEEAIRQVGEKRLKSPLSEQRLGSCKSFKS